MLAKVDNCNYYSYSEGMLHFLYYPESGMVKASNTHSSHRAIEHFAMRGFEIDWLRTNMLRNTLYVILPDHLTVEESLSILSKTKEGLYAEELAIKQKARADIILNNVDNTTGEVIKEQYLIDTIGRLNQLKNKSREDIADWYNKYNIEKARPDNPIIICSTKAKKTIISEGKKIIWSLFEEGNLRKLTKEEFETKMTKCT